MAASTTDKITDTRNGARPTSARVSTARTAGATNLACNGLTGWPTASKVHFVTYQIDTNSNPIAGSQLDCYGIVSGSTLTSVSILDGTDGGNSVGDVVEMLPTASWGQDLSDALLVAHDRTGAHKSGLVLPSPVIADFSSATHTHANAANGGLLANNSVSSAMIATAAVSTLKLDFSAITAMTSGSVALSGASVVDVSTSIIAIPTGCTKVLVLGAIRLQSTNASLQDIQTYMDYETGTSTSVLCTTSSALNATYTGSTNSFLDIMSVTAGSRTFKLKGYTTAGATATVNIQKLLIIPLGA